MVVSHSSPVVYHETLEKRYIFPEFEERKSRSDSTGVLRQQHDAGRRRLTDIVLRQAAVISSVTQIPETR
jgi:hypothetical protein